MATPSKYSIHTDTKFGPLELIDVPALVAACKEKWFNQTLCQVNDAVVRLGIVHGQFHWHKHDDEDEFFLVLSGRFIIELEDHTVELGPQQGFMVPRGVMHNPSAPVPTVVLMVEKSSVIPTGN
ncbi:MAG: cupin domain-containing protein [Candidatus Acidiferrales bacterium]